MSNTRVHPLSWLLSNNRLEEVCGTLTKGTFSSRLLLSNQDKGCTPSVAHSLPLPLPPGFCSTCRLVMFMKKTTICRSESSVCNRYVIMRKWIKWTSLLPLEYTLVNFSCSILCWSLLFSVGYNPTCGIITWDTQQKMLWNCPE